MWQERPGDGDEQGDFVQTLAQARDGSSSALGRLLMTNRDFLLLLAERKLDEGLRCKVSASDLVQETFLEAQRDLSHFEGGGPEMRAWLCRILLNNLANVSRAFYGTEKRDVGREVGLPDQLPAPDGPSARAIADEDLEALEAALARLPDRYREVIRLRYREQRSFAEIGAALGCSAEAARKVWARAVDL